MKQGSKEVTKKEEFYRRGAEYAEIQRKEETRTPKRHFVLRIPSLIAFHGLIWLFPKTSKGGGGVELRLQKKRRRLALRANRSPRKVVWAESFWGILR
jgi:hypothetical protein